MIVLPLTASPDLVRSPVSGQMSVCAPAHACVHDLHPDVPSHASGVYLYLSASSPMARQAAGLWGGGMEKRLRLNTDLLRGLLMYVLV